MNIEELKSLWVEVVDKSTETQILEKEHIKDMISTKSNSAITQIQQAIKTKLYVATMAATLASILAFLSLQADLRLYDTYTPDQTGVVLATLATIVFSVTAVSLKSLRDIRVLQLTNDNIRSRIQRVEALIRRLIKINIYTDAMVAPLLVGVLIGYKLYVNGSFSVIEIGFITTASMVITFIVAIRLNRQLMDRKFGQQLAALNDCLLELEEVEESGTPKHLNDHKTP